MPNTKGLHTPTKPIVMRPPNVLGWPHPLKQDFVPAKSKAYTVKDGDTWESVARFHGLSAKALIDHNFQTTEPAYVNYYLQRITGCNKTYDDVNWAFSSSAKPGKVYIPAQDERDPYLRYAEVIPRITKGIDKKARLTKVLEIIKLAGNPGYRKLWYYDHGTVGEFLGQTKPQKQQTMTVMTHGKVPYDGQTGFGTTWRVYPFQDLIERWALRYDVSPTNEDLELELAHMDRMIHTSWTTVQTARDPLQYWGPQAGEFKWHVNELSKSKTHLYSAYR